MDEKNYGENWLGNVIRIISDIELIVDVGESILNIGDQITVYAVGDEIFDLNGDSLGFFEYDKKTLGVVSTTPKFSVCRAKSHPAHPQLQSLTSLISQNIVEYESLNVDENSIQEIMISNKNNILVGDPIKKTKK